MRKLLSCHAALLIACLAVWGCGRAKAPRGGPPQGNPAEGTAAPEPWVARPHGEWPQILLTNHAEFRDRRSLRGASCFLARTEQGETVAVTARHLLGPAGGLNPAVPVSEVDARLASWKMSPRTLDEPSVTVQGALRARFDILVLSLREPGRGPFFAPKVRTTPVAIGERVYLVGCPYSDAGCKQAVYPGVVAERPVGHLLDVRLEEAITIRGFSGAPILDANGRAVGVACTGEGTTVGGQELRAVFADADAEAVTLTGRAADKVKELLQAEGLTPDGVLRIRLEEGATRLDLDPNTHPTDWQTEDQGVRIVIDCRDLPRLRGACVDFVPTSGGFTVTAPDPFVRR